MDQQQEQSHDSTLGRNSSSTNITNIDLFLLVVLPRRWFGFVVLRFYRRAYVASTLGKVQL